MPVTLSTAEDALKSLYLDVVTDQLNINTNPLYNKIKASSNYVSGKDVKKLARYGLNGGIGAGTEEGALPTPAGNNYATFTASLKNLYGQIEISDKAIQASRDSAGAFVNLLNDELEGLLKASKFNVSRMLYGDGTGVLTACKANTTATNTLQVESVQNLMEGMVVDILASASAATPVSGGTGRRITAIDRANSTVKITGAALTTTATNVLVVQGSHNLELTGLGAIFSSSQNLYGLTRADYSWLVPYSKASTGALEETIIQTAIDNLEETADGHVDFISCSAGVRRAFLEMMAATRRNVDMMELQGGFKAVSYNGIPVYADRFCPKQSMYLLDTAEFSMHQLCDWRWLEDGNGKILRQVAGTPKFTATLVKYAELMCDKPMAQARLLGITEA